MIHYPSVKQSRAKAQVAILKNDNGQSFRTMRITQGGRGGKMAKAAAKMKEAASKAEASKAGSRAGRESCVGRRGGRRRRRAIHHTTARGGQGRLREAAPRTARSGGWIGSSRSRWRAHGPQTKSQGLEARTASRRKSGTCRSGPESAVRTRRPLPLS